MLFRSLVCRSSLSYRSYRDSCSPCHLPFSLSASPFLFYHLWASSGMAYPVSQAEVQKVGEEKWNQETRQKPGGS